MGVVDLRAWVAALRGQQVSRTSWEDFENQVGQLEVQEALSLVYGTTELFLAARQADPAALLRMMLRAIDAVPGETSHPGDESWIGYVSLHENGVEYYTDSPGIAHDSGWLPVEAPAVGSGTLDTEPEPPPPHHLPTQPGITDTRTTDTRTTDPAESQRDEEETRRELEALDELITSLERNVDLLEKAFGGGSEADDFLEEAGKFGLVTIRERDKDAVLVDEDTLKNTLYELEEET